MDKKEILKLKLQLMKEVLNSDNPSELLKEYNEKYPELLDKTLIMMDNKKNNQEKISTKQK